MSDVLTRDQAIAIWMLEGDVSQEVAEARFDFWFLPQFGSRVTLARTREGIQAYEAIVG